MIAGLSVSLVYADSVNLFSDALGPRGAKLQRQTDKHFSKRICKFNFPDTIMDFFFFFTYNFNIILILDF